MKVDELWPLEPPEVVVGRHNNHPIAGRVPSRMVAHSSDVLHLVYAEVWWA